MAEALIDVVRFVESSDDEQMNLDDAVKLLEGVGHLLGQLSAGQRAELLDLIAEMADAESDPSRREFIEQFPDGFGLLDDED
ncbi:hypothetical protein ACIBSV_43675 [Embleya sp. NPDC050154]|uniref:hypothetical protein n=1 Tax=Embleya sp. NPDC050154 TaxID=3363988 RepID=UPI0037B3749C